MTTTLQFYVCVLLVVKCQADVYMHNPPGSNNRNRERNNNRNNDNRLFDSQNNVLQISTYFTMFLRYITWSHAKGGYPWRGNQYYEGSLLNLEWTNQHACGDNPSTNCNFVIQYACEDTMPGLRDGYPSGNLQNVNNQGNNNAPLANTATDTEYGMNENLAWYQTCQNTERNKGLYVADQDLNGNDARFTRQNPNGNRSGFECPEERDYYPYWLQTPWRDVAILTSNTDWCDYYQSESGNVKTKYVFFFNSNQFLFRRKFRITQETCQGTWTAFTETKNGKTPDCELSAASRQNHLGNAGPVCFIFFITKKSIFFFIRNFVPNNFFFFFFNFFSK
eukprot:GSMAST32.ASY1.ANO1.449.1 assembled CDS